MCLKIADLHFSDVWLAFPSSHVTKWITAQIVFLCSNNLFKWIRAEKDFYTARIIMIWLETEVVENVI